MDRESVKAAMLDLLRDDPEVQGAVLALVVGALGGPQGQPQAATLAMPQQRQKPDWVLRQLQAQEGGR